MAVEPHPDLPPSLYKYCSQDAARAILSSKTLRFSRPGLFNDGFDLRIELASLHTGGVAGSVPASPTIQLSM
jgi:hypothetical protein